MRIRAQSFPFWCLLFCSFRTQDRGGCACQTPWNSAAVFDMNSPVSEWVGGQERERNQKLLPKSPPPGAPSLIRLLTSEQDRTMHCSEDRVVRPGLCATMILFAFRLLVYWKTLVLVYRCALRGSLSMCTAPQGWGFIGIRCGTRVNLIIYWNVV